MIILFISMIKKNQFISKSFQSSNILTPNNQHSKTYIFKYGNISNNFLLIYDTKKSSKSKLQNVIPLIGTDIKFSNIDKKNQRN